MSADEPTYPIRTELTVLPADPEREPIGFSMYEYNGTEVFKADAPGVRLTSRGDIQEGDKLHVLTLFGTLDMVAIRGASGDLLARTESGRLVADLVFAQDNRRCWVSTHASHVRGLGRELERR